MNTSKRYLVSLAFCGLNATTAVLCLREAPFWALGCAFIAGCSLVLAAWDWCDP